MLILLITKLMSLYTFTTQNKYINFGFIMTLMILLVFYTQSNCYLQPQSTLQYLNLTNAIRTIDYRLISEDISHCLFSSLRLLL